MEATTHPLKGYGPSWKGLWEKTGWWHSFELPDGRMIRGKCNCSHHFKGGLRRGPCRHLQALRNSVLAGAKQPTLEKWFDQLWVANT